MDKKIKILFIIIFVLTISIILFFGAMRYKNNSKYSIEEIWFYNDKNQKIFGELYKPKKDGKVPLIIYSHGLGSTYTVGEGYADKLIDYDIAILTIDFRGGSDESKSDGSTREMSIMTELDDLRTVLNEAKKWDFVDVDKIVVMGGSQGGVVSALMSAEDQSINTAVLLYPALTLPSYAANMYKNGDIRDKMGSVYVGENYFSDVVDLDVYETISKDENNILILHGDEDSTVPISVSEKALEIYKNVEFHVIEGAGHGFTGNNRKKALEYIIEYFKKNDII